MRNSSAQRQQPQLFWPRVVMRKWLNISTKDSDYSADPDSDFDSGSDSDSDQGALPRVRRRRKSETFRAQYINTKELRVCAGTWNVAGKFPSDDLDLDEWFDINDPADIYVIGFQEIIPLNAGNIFGAEDNRPVLKWENIIRETLNKVPPVTKYKCYSDPPSPSKFKPMEDAPDIEDEILLESDSDGEEEIYPLNEEPDGVEEFRIESDAGENVLAVNDASLSSDSKSPSTVDGLERQFSSPKRLDRLTCFRTDTDDCTENGDESTALYNRRLTKTISGTERIGLSWPEPPLDLLSQRIPERPNSFKSFKSFKASKSIYQFGANGDKRLLSDATLLAELDLESLINRKRRSQYVRIISKQMVGIFLTIWVRRSLRRHIQNLHVSTVGVGAMGYIGNKGSISVSMSINQSLFCFVCTHLTSGEREVDLAKRNADVHEIHRRTHFNSLSTIGLPKTIRDHERIIWLGDLNYRINLSYEKTKELISKKDWSNLLESDQLIKELKKGRPFDGWTEGTLNFPPTYKYEINSEKYIGEDHKGGRRNPAWCDRILSLGKGMRLLNYRRTELTFSDHRPVTASYMVEVEVFSSKKLQRALTFTDAEIEGDQFVSDIGGAESGMSRSRFGEEARYWDR